MFKIIHEFTDSEKVNKANLRNVRKVYPTATAEKFGSIYYICLATFNSKSKADSVFSSFYKNMFCGVYEVKETKDKKLIVFDY